MATHSSALAWKIPRMEEPGRLQSLGSLQVGHDWVTSLTHKHVVNFTVSTYGHHVIQFSDYLNEVIIIFLLYRWELLFNLQHLCCLWLDPARSFTPLFILIFLEVLELIHPDVLSTESPHLRSRGQVTMTSSGADLSFHMVLFATNLYMTPWAFPFAWPLYDHSVSIILLDYHCSPWGHLPLALAHVSESPLDFAIDPFSNK